MMFEQAINNLKSDIAMLKYMVKFPAITKNVEERILAWKKEIKELQRAIKVLQKASDGK